MAKQYRLYEPDQLFLMPPSLRDWLAEVHGIRGADFGASRSAIILITLLPIIAALLTLHVLVRSQVSPLSRASIALWMLLGIWFFGPFCMIISAGFSGGGFLSSEVWRSLASVALLFVPYTFVMSTYDATLAALLVITIRRKMYRESFLALSPWRDFGALVAT